jgi:RNA polymerase sigma factor (sigma-70 family)
VAIPADAFRDVFTTHYDDLVRFVRRRTDHDHGEDIVEETFLTLWQQRAMPPHVRPWLFATARNLMLNAHRGHRRREALAVRIAGALEPATADHARAADLRMDLVAAWRRLSAADQEVLALALWEDLPAAEAAEVLGCSKAAYLMRLSRAKARLAPLVGSARLVPVL